MPKKNDKPPEEVNFLQVRLPRTVRLIGKYRNKPWESQPLPITWTADRELNVLRAKAQFDTPIGFIPTLYDAEGFMSGELCGTITQYPGYVLNLEVTLPRDIKLS